LKIDNTIILASTVRQKINSVVSVMRNLENQLTTFSDQKARKEYANICDLPEDSFLNLSSQIDSAVQMLNSAIVYAQIAAEDIVKSSADWVSQYETASANISLPVSNKPSLSASSSKTPVKPDETTEVTGS
jgi:hypothetical protein